MHVNNASLNILLIFFSNILLNPYVQGRTKTVVYAYRDSNYRGRGLVQNLPTNVNIN